MPEAFFPPGHAIQKQMTARIIGKIMSFIFQPFQQHKATESKILSLLAPLFRQRELAVVVFGGVLSGIIAGAVLFTAHHPSERSSFATAKATPATSEQPTNRYTATIGLASA